MRWLQTNEKWGFRGEEAPPLTWISRASGHFRPVHFHSWVAGRRVQYIGLICTPNHQRGHLGTLHRRVVGIRMANGTGHRPMHSTSLGHGMFSLDLNWDITQQGRQLNLSEHWCCQHQRCVEFSLASLSQSLSSVVKPTRSQSSSWHSLWNLLWGREKCSPKYSTLSVLGMK